MITALRSRGTPFAYAHTSLARGSGPGLVCGARKLEPASGYLVFRVDEPLLTSIGTFPTGETVLYVASIGFTCIYQRNGAAASSNATSTAPVAAGANTPAPAPPDADTGAPFASPGPISDPPAPSGTSPPVQPVDNTAALEANKSNLCFPASSTVVAHRGPLPVRIRMDDLRIGDVISDGLGGTTTVYAFSHRDASARTTFARVSLKGGGAITASASHLLLTPARPVAAGAMTPGDPILLASGRPGQVASVRAVGGRGLYAPMTLSGTLVVDDAAASAYTTSLDPSPATAVLAPLRAAFLLRQSLRSLLASLHPPSTAFWITRFRLAARMSIRGAMQSARLHAARTPVC